MKLIGAFRGYVNSPKFHKIFRLYVLKLYGFNVIKCYDFAAAIIAEI
jgi:hypothetical protein